MVVEISDDQHLTAMDQRQIKDYTTVLHDSAYDNMTEITLVRNNNNMRVYISRNIFKIITRATFRLSSSSHEQVNKNPK